MPLDDFIEKVRLSKSKEALERIKRTLLGIHLTPEDAHEALQYLYCASDIRFTVDKTVDSIKSVECDIRILEGRKFRLEEDHAR
jgi:hypothetical protein